MHQHPEPELTARLRRDTAWLRALALSLARDRSRADDLVQETWATALEHDDGVLPRRAWLSQVLRNHFLQALRSEGRRSAREERATPPAQQPAPDEQVARAEASQLLLEALLRLREPYRTTLLKRYQQGLSAARIARAEGVPAATVRARALRGLQLLRGELEGRLGPDRQHCQALLLLVAGRGAAWKLPSLAAGGIAASLVLGAVVLGAVVLLPRMIAEQPPAASEAPASPTARADDDASARVDGTAASGVLRTDLVAPQEPAPPSGTADEAALIIRGRCVRAEDGQPLEGVVLSFHYQEPQTDPLAGAPGAAWQPPEVRVTGADGVFEYRLVDPPSEGGYTINLEAEGRLLRRIGWGRRYGTRIAATDFGDIPFLRGTTLYGRVVDEDGAPVPLGSVRPDDLRDQHLLAPGEGVAVTARIQEDGSFEFATALPPGPRGVRVRCEGYLPVGPDVLQVEDHLGRQEVVFTMRAMPYVEGIVTYPGGAPVRGAQVRAMLPQSGWMATSHTDAEGKFRVHDTKDIEQRFALEVTRRGLRTLLTEPVYSWGDRNVELVVETAGYVDIAVVEAGSGKPVEEFLIATRPSAERASSSRIGNLRSGGHHPDGWLRVDGLHDGINLLLVVPLDPLLGHSGILTIDPDADAGERLLVELAPRVPVTVEVVRDDGSPVIGSRVVAAEEFSGPFAHRMRDLRTDGLWTWLEHMRVSALSSGTTGDDGCVTLHLPPERAEWQLRVSGAHPDQQRTVAMPDAEPRRVTVTVPSRVLVQGTLLLPEGSRDAMALTFKRLGSSIASLGVAKEDVVRVDADGRFSCTLDPGHYAATFLRMPGAEAGEVTVTFGSGWMEVQPPLQEFVLEPGKPVELELDARALLPGSVTGVLRVDGEPVAGARFRIGGTRGPFGVHYTDTEGRFTVDGLEPGEVHLRYSGPPDAPFLVEGVSSQTATVRPGEQVRLDVDFRPRAVRVRVHDAAGAPLRATKVEFRSNAGTRDMTTDDEGWLTIPRLAPCQFRVATGGGTARTYSELLQVEAGDGELVLEAVITQH